MMIMKPKSYLLRVSYQLNNTYLYLQQFSLNEVIHFAPVFRISCYTSFANSFPEAGCFYGTVVVAMEKKALV